MRKAVLTNGALAIYAETAEDTELLTSIKENQNLGSEAAQMAELLDSTGWLGNGELLLVAPEEINALTDSVILTDLRIEDENGELETSGAIWWYPQYETTSWLDELLTKGVAIFTAN